MAEIPLESIIPRIRMVIMSFTFEEMIMINSITAPAPTHDAATRIQLPKPFKLSGEIFREKPKITKATPRLAPELIPRTSGPAIGFLNTVCICKPLKDKATPTVNAVMAFGNLNFSIMVSKLLCVPEKNTLITSEALILTDPKKISRIMKIITRTNNPEKIILNLFPDLLLEDDFIFILVFNKTFFNKFS